jgi:hypothetical protein
MGMEPPSDPKAPRIDAERAEELIRQEEEKLGRSRYFWYLINKSPSDFSFGTVSAIHSTATVDRRTGAVLFDD